MPSFFSLSSYTGGLNQATARELQEASDAGDKEVHADVDAGKCFCVVFFIISVSLCMGNGNFFIWKSFLFCSLGNISLQFGREETGASPKAPPALIAFATVAILPARQFIDSLLIALNIESNFASGYSASIVGN